MATATVGELIKEARTKKGLSQAAVAEEVDGLSATDLSKCERGEKELTQAQLKAIAKVVGCTQKSLLEAPSGVKKTSEKKKTASSSAAKKTETKKTESKKTDSKKKTTSSAKKDDDYTLTNAEKSLIKAYRAADSETKKNALAVLKGEKKVSEDMLNSILSAGMDLFGGKK